MEALKDKGMEISGGYTAEVWGNTTGGLKQGAVYTGLLDFRAKVDFEKLVGWKGATLLTGKLSPLLHAIPATIPCLSFWEKPSKT